MYPERKLKQKAGPVLDQMVHEHVMGYEPLEEGGWRAPNGDLCPVCWPYSTSSVWSHVVAETMLANHTTRSWDGFALRSTRHPDHGLRWHASFRRDLMYAWAEGVTPEEAICLAALLAIEVERRSAPERK